MKAGRWRVDIIDPKGGEFRDLLSDKAIYLSGSDLRLNPHYAPRGVDRKAWSKGLGEVWADTFTYLTGSEGHMSKLVIQTDEKYTQRGIIPTFEDLYNEIKSTPPENRKEMDYQGVLLNRAQAILLHLKEPLRCRRGFLEELLDFPLAIYDLSDFPGFAQRFVVISILYFLFMAHKLAYLNGTPRRTLFIVDESQADILSVGQQNSARQSSPAISQMISQSRAFGLGIMASAQRVKAVIDEINADSSLQLAMNLAGEEGFYAGRIMGLDPQKAAILPHLRPGQAIVRCANIGFTHPCIVNLDYPEFLRKGYHHDEALWKRNAERIRKLQAIAEPVTEDIRQNPKYADIGIPTANAEKLLLTIGENREALLLTEFYKKGNLHPSIGDKVRDQLEKGGYIQIVKIPSAGRAATAILTDKGRQSFKNITNRDPEEMEKTSLEGNVHRWWVNRLKTYWDNRDAKVQVAPVLGGQEADLVVGLKGDRIAFEVTLTKTNLQEKVKMLHHVDRLVYLVENIKEAAKVKKALEVPPELKDRIEFKSLGDFLQT